MEEEVKNVVQDYVTFFLLFSIGKLQCILKVWNVSGQRIPIRFQVVFFIQVLNTL